MAKLKLAPKGGHATGSWGVVPGGNPTGREGVFDQLEVRRKLDRLRWVFVRGGNSTGRNGVPITQHMAKPKFIEDQDQLEKLAPVMKAPIKRHVFVCNGKSCSQVGSAEVKAEFVRILEEKGLRQGKESKGRNPMGEIVLTDCGSVGFCSIGVAVLVYPEGVWYGQVQAEDVPEIIEEHLEKGRVVERLALIELDPS